MRLRIIVAMLLVFLLFAACNQKPKAEFYIMQDAKLFSGDEVTIAKKTFSLMSNKAGYSVVIAKQPIRNLADHLEIVKLNGTSGAWYPGELPFYQSSDLLSDSDACLAYYGNLGKGCQAYIKEKRRLGFRLHYAYTFAEYMILKKHKQIIKLGRKNIEKLASGSYYLYFFRSEDNMGAVARSQRVTRMKINFK